MFSKASLSPNILSSASDRSSCFEQSDTLSMDSGLGGSSPGAGQS